MTVPELDLSAPNLRRPQSVFEVEVVREITEADIALLASGRGTTAPTIKAIRERHHSLARCLASGMSEAEASAITGYCSSRISILKSDPTFQELLAHYRSNAASGYADYQDRATQVALTALDLVAERLEDEPDNVSTGAALEIAKVLGDRTGHAPVARTQNVNVNVDLAARMARAKERLSLFTPTLIGAT